MNGYKHTNYRYICKGRIYDKSLKQYVYYIAKIDDANSITVMCAKELRKHLLKLGNVVKGIRITSDGRIYLDTSDRDNNDISNKYGDSINYTDNYKSIRVGELIEGHILNQNIAFTATKQTHGQVKNVLDSEQLICGVGYVCNKNKIEQIKEYYADSCIVNIMSADDVRNAIIEDVRFRHRLAIFYAKQIREPKYIHASRIKDITVIRRFQTYSRKILNAEFLERDINLMMMLFVLYGYHMYTFEHSVDVAIYACMLYLSTISDNNDIDKKMFIDLFICGLLHDIGKIAIPVDILDEKGETSSEDWEIIKRHPIYSFKIVTNLCKCDSKIFKEYKNDVSRRNRLTYGVLLHHRSAEDVKDERRAGYPLECKYQNYYEDIAEFLKIISVADCIDGMLSPRPYRARRGQKAVGKQRNYIGCKEMTDFLLKDASCGKLGGREVGFAVRMMYNDESHDFDDEYGEKIVDTSFNMGILNNFSDLTKDRRYIEIPL